MAPNFSPNPPGYEAQVRGPRRGANKWLKVIWGWATSSLWHRPWQSDQSHLPLGPCPPYLPLQRPLTWRGILPMVSLFSLSFTSQNKQQKSKGFKKSLKGGTWVARCPRPAWGCQPAHPQGQGPRARPVSSQLRRCHCPQGGGRVLGPLQQAGS